HRYLADDLAVRGRMRINVHHQQGVIAFATRRVERSHKRVLLGRRPHRHSRRRIKCRIWLEPLHRALLGLRRNFRSELSIDQTDLVCPAARHIGCGSAAKPLLLELERDAHVDEAWLNRAGTVVAVVWKEPRTTKQRTEIIQSVFKEQNVRELKGEAREQALKG